MPRQATGNIYESRGKWYARVAIGPGKRVSLALPTCGTTAAADARLVILAKLAAKLRAAGHEERAQDFLERAAVREGRELASVLRLAEGLCRGDERAKRAGPVITVRDLGERWTSGELAHQYPDHIREKRSANHDALRLARYVYPVLGDEPIAAFTLDHAETVMKGIPEGRSTATRRHVGQLLHRLLAMAVFPLRLLSANPLPRGFLPKVGPGKAKGYLYPDEDARLMACETVPLPFRLLYGFLDREGPRASEAEGLAWADFDLDRGVVKLDENKTDDPRAWALDMGVLRGLRAYRELLAERGAAVGPDDRVFVLRDNDRHYDAARQSVIAARRSPRVYAGARAAG
jgi:integrase